MSRIAPLLLALVAASCADRGVRASAADVQVEIVDLTGIDLALSQRLGTACLVNFWATWCPPCVAELPELLEVAAEYEDDGGRVLGISYDLMIPGVARSEVEDLVRRFLVARDLPLPTLIYDAPDYDAIDARFELPGAIPVTLALDRAGNVVDRHEGEASRERFDEMMRRALGR